MRVHNSAGKGTSGMDRFGSVIDRMNMKLGSKFLNSFNIKTQLLERLQRVIVVDNAAHFQKDGLEESNRESLRGGDEAFSYAVAARRSASFAVECPHSTQSQ
jgi:hypothetical protein